MVTKQELKESSNLEIVEYKKGSYCVVDTNKVTLEEVFEAFADLPEDFDTEDIVDAAKDPNSPFHHVFDWDDKVAAQNWRKHQARLLMNSVDVVVENKNSGERRRVNAFESVPVEFKSSGAQGTKNYGGSDSSENAGNNSTSNKVGSTNEDRRYKTVTQVDEEEDQVQHIIDRTEKELKHKAEKLENYRDIFEHHRPDIADLIDMMQEVIS